MLAYTNISDAILKADDLVVERNGGLDSLQSVLTCSGRYTAKSAKEESELDLDFDFILDGKQLRLSTIRASARP